MLMKANCGYSILMKENRLWEFIGGRVDMKTKR
jgi:hypothetical protein